MSTPETIERLLARISLRERDALRDLYQHTNAKLFGILLRLLKDRQEAEDALQEVYAKVWYKADTYSRRGLSPMSWLIAITRNHAIDILRARKPAADPIDEAHAIASAEASPEDVAVLRSEGRRIGECMEELDQRHAQAVVRAYVHGNSYDELAAHYGVPLNTMRTWLRRSLIKLKDCLER